MKPSQSRSLLIATFAACVIAGSGVAQTPPQYTLRVNGEPVVSARQPELIGGQWFVPLTPVARALGVDVRLDANGQTLRIVRGDGVTASYDAASGRILQGSIMAAQVANYRLIQLNVGLDNILFPLDGMVALFGVSVREDLDQQALEIGSAPAGGGPAINGTGPFFQLSSLEDRFVMSTNGHVWQQSVNLRGYSLLGANTVRGNVDMGSGSGNPMLSLRQGFIRIETPAHRAVTIGDQGTYSGVEAMSNTVRGLGYEWRWGKFTFDVFGGRAASSISAALGSSGLAAYDSVLSGFGVRRRGKIYDLSLSANAFRSSQRSGTTFAAGFASTYKRNEFRLQALTGYFSGTSLRAVLQLADANTQQTSAALAVTGSPLLPQSTAPGSVVEVQQNAGQVNGGAFGFSVVDTYTPFSRKILSFTGLWEHYSRNFLVVRDDSRFTAVSRKSLSSNFRPFRYINFSGGIRDNSVLVGSATLERGYTYGVNGSLPGRIPILPGFFRSIQLTSGPLGRFVLTQYSLQVPRVKRFTAGVTYSEVRFAGSRSKVITENVTADLKRYGRLGFHDQLQLASGHNYGVDWTQGFGKNGAYFMGGIERLTAIGQKPGFAPVASFRIPMPRHQSLLVSYYSVRGSSLFRFELGGPLIRRREVVTLNDTQTVMMVPASVAGQIYHDINLDGRYEHGVDRALGMMMVWLDDETSTTTDPNGYFRFDGITTGMHRLRVDMSSVPAHLILAAEDLKVAVMPYRANRQDFRAIPGGKIEGTITIVKKDENGRDQVTVVPDMHILMSGNRDTFSEGDGMFVLADLPPGTYQLKLDPATMPVGFVSRPAVRTVEVKAGKSTGGTDFRLERPVVVKPAPGQGPVLVSHAGGQ